MGFQRVTITHLPVKVGRNRTYNSVFIKIDNPYLNGQKYIFSHIIEPVQ